MIFSYLLHLFFPPECFFFPSSKAPGVGQETTGIEGFDGNDTRSFGLEDVWVYVLKGVCFWGGWVGVVVHMFFFTAFLVVLFGWYGYVFLSGGFSMQLQQPRGERSFRVPLFFGCGSKKWGPSKTTVLGSSWHSVTSWIEWSFSLHLSTFTMPACRSIWQVFHVWPPFCSCMQPCLRQPGHISCLLC